MSFGHYFIVFIQKINSIPIISNNFSKYQSIKSVVMKKLCVFMFVLVMLFPVYSQENGFEEYYEYNDLPAVVLKKAGDQFSVYYPDNSNPDSRVLELENKFISYKIDNDFQGKESYLLLLEIEDGFLSATFNAKGKLVSVVEKFENVKLPEKIRNSLAQKFPEWEMLKDRFLYVQKHGKIKRKEYKIIMKKDNKIKRVVVNEDGVIIRGKS